MEMVLVLCVLFLGTMVFLAGACVFSFLNVVAYRVPRKISFVRGFSVCPACGHRLGPADLIPIVSYLTLRGRCRYCRARIGARDTVVEALGGVLALACACRFPDRARALLFFLFFCVLAVVALLDLDTMEIADGCHAAVLLLALAACLVMPEVRPAQRLAGMVCVSVPMLLLSLAVPGAFGGGDIKLMAACGLFLGWRLTLVSAVLAVLAGGAYGIWLLASGKKGRKDSFAFGPFLCFGMAVAALYGRELLAWYLGFWRI